MDLNNSDSEIKATRQAALAKGDEVIVIPQEGSKYSLDELKTILAENKIKSIVISGHSGGAKFTGKNVQGEARIEDLLTVLKDNKQTETESLYLMGCYTANKSKVSLWKNSLPQLKFIAGFSGQGPANTTSQGPRFLKDCIMKQNEIFKNNETEALKKVLGKLDSIGKLDAALYLDCGENKELYYTSMSPLKERLTSFDAQNCGEKLAIFKEQYLPEVRKFWNGELEATQENTQTGILRKAYALSREFEHCLGPDMKFFIPEMNPESLFFLLFNKDFNRNFVTYNKDEIKELHDDILLSESDPNLYIQKMNDFYDNRSAKANALFNDPNFKKALQAEASSVKNKLSTLLSADPTLEECRLWNRNCNSSKSTLSQYKRLSNLSDFLKDPKKNWEDIYSKPSEIKPLTISGNAKSILAKMVNESDKVSRKEMAELKDSMDKANGNSRSLSDLDMKLYDAMALAEDHPFSWHEFKKDEPVEFYDRSYVKSENALINELLNLK